MTWVHVVAIVVGVVTVVPAIVTVRTAGLLPHGQSALRHIDLRHIKVGTRPTSCSSRPV